MNYYYVMFFVGVFVGCFCYFYYIVPEWKDNALLRGGESYAAMVEQERKE